MKKKIGRVKLEKNEPRVCDIDIIDFKGLVTKTRTLELPHPRCYNRNFVLYPIREIDPNWIHPILKKNVDFLIRELNQKARRPELTGFILDKAKKELNYKPTSFTNSLEVFRKV